MPSLLSSSHHAMILQAIILVTSSIHSAIATCNRPQTPQHATLIFESPTNRPSQLPNGYIVRVVCDDLFQLVGNGDGFMTCRNGQWSNSFTCAAICDRLPHFPRGTIRYSQGDTKARYRCTTEGYRLEGNGRRRCLRNGTWSGKRPRCMGIPTCEQPKVEECHIQRRLAGRKEGDVWVVGTILQFSCGSKCISLSEHYPAIECTHRGWNGTAPTCFEVGCNPLLETIKNGSSSAQNRTYGLGEAITYSCDPGYRTTSRSWRVCSVKRGSDGSVQPSWEGVTPRCGETRCSPPKQIENGETVVSSTGINGTATFICRSGFELIGEPVLICQENGQWNGTAPVCSNDEYYCPPLAAPLNGFKTGNQYSLNQTVEFSCETGYTLSGSDVRECLIDGQWSGEEARCIGNLDFDDINHISADLVKRLDRLTVENLFESEPQYPVSNVSLHGRFIPSQHQYGVDIYFLFDSSYSVGEENFMRSKEFAIEIVRKIGVTSRRNSLRVGALYFSNVANIVFRTGDLTTTNAVINQGLSNIPYVGGDSNITDALRSVNEDIPKSSFREGSYKTVFLITNGEAVEGNSPETEARKLKAGDIKIHCLGIGEDASRRQLLAIGSKPHNEHIFWLKNYKSLTQLATMVINETGDYSDCGISKGTVSRGRVVGGETANRGAWPWQVLLEISKGSLKGKCGGALIDRNWVLTAAHCVTSSSGSKYTVTAKLGITDMSKPRGYQEIEVAETIKHPEYNQITLQNDIALLKLSQSVILNANVRVVCLPNKTRAVNRLFSPNPSNLPAAIVTGWGHNQRVPVDSDTALYTVDQLQQLALPLRSRNDCMDSLVNKREYDFFDTSMFCAGYSNAFRGACKGDSGGPLVYKAIQQRQRRWVLIGLTSWGRGCAVRNELDFFTNVTHFIDWITETMNQPLGEPDSEDSTNAQGGENYCNSSHLVASHATYTVHQQTVEYGSIARYTCNDGFTQIGGSSERACTGGKSWNGSAIVCWPNPGSACFDPPHVENARHNGSEEYYFAGDIVAYECDPGYYRAGSLSPLLMCRGSERSLDWANFDMTCLPLCTMPQDPPDGQWVTGAGCRNGDDQPPGCQLSYTCSAGFIQRSTEVAYVCVGPTWQERELPLCRREYSCDNSDLPANLVKHQSEEHESTGNDYFLRVTCEDGYILRLGYFLSCVDGFWKGNTFCEAALCTIPQDPPDGQWITGSGCQNGPYQPPGCQLSYICSAGFNQRSTDVVYVCVGQTWHEKEPPLCGREDSCDNSNLPAFRRLVKHQSEEHESTSNGGFLRVTCEDSYILRSGHFLVCEDGVWEGHVYCQDPEW